MQSELYEVWAWYIIGVLIILTRYAVRIRTVGLRGFQGDDYLTFATLFFYTLDATTVTIVYHTGQNIDVTEADLPSLTAADIRRYTYGSKIELTAWYSYSTLIWCMKFTMLFFYKRLTLGSLHNKLVRYLFWICGVAYTAVFLTISLGCYPIQMNWQVVPIPPWKCRFRPQLFLVIAVLNILTDAALLSIPIPMLWRLKIPIRKKVVISLILSSGLFVITAAIIRVVYSLDAKPSASNINRWGVRETIIGIIAINIPILRPLFTRAFWSWGGYDPATAPSKKSSRLRRGKRLPDLAFRDRDVELGTTTIESTLGGQTNSTSSEKQILEWDCKDDGVVYVQTSYDIQTHDRDEGASMKAMEQDWNGHTVSG